MGMRYFSSFHFHFFFIYKTWTVVGRNGKYCSGVKSIVTQGQTKYLTDERKDGREQPLRHFKVGIAVLGVRPVNDQRATSHFLILKRGFEIVGAK